MEDNKLTQYDNENISVLEALESSILEQYNILKKLEIEGKTETEEFKSAIIKLNSSIDLENEVLGRFGNNPYKLEKVLSHFADTKEVVDFSKELNIAANYDAGGVIKRRIVQQIVGIISNTKSIDDSDINKLARVSIEIKRDFIKTILNFVNTYIFDEKYYHIRNKLIELKYNISYIYKFIETDLLENNFSVNPELYWSSKALAEINGIDNERFKSFQIMYGEEIYNSNILKLFKEQNASDYNILVEQIYARVSLLFIGQNEVDKLRNKKNKGVYISKMMFGDDFQEPETIKEVFSAFESDQEIPNVISFASVL